MNHKIIRAIVEEPLTTLWLLFFATFVVLSVFLIQPRQTVRALMKVYRGDIDALDADVGEVPVDG